MLSEGTGYDGLSKDVLADEYVAFIVQHFHDKTGIKSNLKYQKIIEDEYERKNKDRSHGDRGDLYGNRNAREPHAENNRESKDERNLLSGGVPTGFRQGNTTKINYYLNSLVSNISKYIPTLTNVEVVKNIDDILFNIGEGSPFLDINAKMKLYKKAFGERNSKIIRNKMSIDISKSKSIKI
jgi:hypothetical protein